MKQLLGHAMAWPAGWFSGPGWHSVEATIASCESGGLALSPRCFSPPNPGRGEGASSEGQPPPPPVWAHGHLFVCLQKWGRSLLCRTDPVLSSASLSDSVNAYCLHIAEDDGEVDTDFPPLDCNEPIHKFGFSTLALVEKYSSPGLAAKQSLFVRM